jgi:NitT/TauT family transport system substrate-binding protein
MIKKKMLIIFVFIVIALVSILSGCGTIKTTSSHSATTSSSQPTASGQEQKSKPDKLTPVKIAVVSNNIDFLPWYLAVKKGIFEKYNLKVDIQTVDGGVIALRGLESGDFQFISSLMESVITSVDAGANVKMIGALDNQALYSIIVSPEINKIEDLKGKAAGVLQPGNGTDIVMRWWLKKHGLEPNKDVRIVNAGGNPSRLAALQNKQVQVTLLQAPSDINAEKIGMKRLGNISDEVQNYNHTVIAANEKLLKDQPEVARAFIAATAEAIAFVKDPSNRKEAIKIGMDTMGNDEEITTKSLDFAMNKMADQAKFNVEGVKWAIQAVNETGITKNKVALNNVIDESFYSTK